MNIHFNLFFKKIFVLWLFFNIHTVHAAMTRLAPEEVPTPLKPWVNWVLAGEETALCPHINQQPNCVWANQLALNVSEQGAKFRITVQASQSDWFLLPGNAETYPINVTANGAPAPTIDHEDVPSLYLKAGTYQIEGEFRWTKLPDALPIPTQIGLIALSQNGQNIAHPRRDSNGQLELKNTQNQETNQAQGDALTIQVFRKIQDGIPYQIETQIQLDVSGKPRELTLPLALFAGERLHRIESDLPAQLALPNTRLQLRAGRWQLRLFSHRWGHQWTLPPAVSPWPSHEIWTWQADPDLRTVTLQTQGSAHSIDSRQTEIVEAWRDLPAWRLEQGAATQSNGLQLTVQQRGESKTHSDELHLQRYFWLDFNGDGYTAQDTITGNIRQQWRMQAQPELKLGRVNLRGEPQFITCLADSSATMNQKNCPRGVEVGRGELTMTADSRLFARLGDVFGLFAQVPITGWQHSFLSVENTLFLGPGWRVLGVFGVDNVPDTWFGQWNLLDLFLWLILSLAIWKLHGKKWGILALVSLGIAWHEAHNFTLWAWLLLVVWLALRRALPENWQNGRLATGLLVARWASTVLWVILMVAFMLPTLRLMLHPQLENETGFDQIAAPAASFNNEAIPAAAEADAAAAPMTEAEPMAGNSAEMVQQARSSVSPKIAKTKDSYDSWGSEDKQALQQFDPTLRMQTGPGLPEWHHDALKLRWDGVVLPDQNMYVFFSPPWLTAIWRGLSILGLLLLGVGVLGVRLLKRAEHPVE